MRLLGALLGLALSCSPTEESAESEVPAIEATESTGPRLVLLVSMDTTRADALSCYADTDHWGQYVRQQMQLQGALPAQVEAISARFPVPSTPNICAMADDGVRFQWALAHAPTTLNSHASMFSGMDPHRHRVVRNGYSIPPDVDLVSERFSEAGWDTIAVLGSSALESKMGLNRGFRDYLDPGPQPAGGMQFLSAAEVGRRVLQQLDARPDPEQDLFLFVHFFDPHMPWFDPRLPEAFAPEEVRAQFVDPRYKGTVDGSMSSIGALTQARKSGRITLGDSSHARALYLSQVSWVDTQLGLLMGELESRGLLTDSLVVITSDHGETLDDSEADPYTHGPSVDLSAIHVPLIMRGQGSMKLGEEPRVVPRMVRLMDLGSTLLSVSGLGAVMGDGQDLSGYWTGDPPAEYPHMAEATRPIWMEATDRWNNLPMAQAVVQDGLIFQKRPQQVAEGYRSSQKLHALAPAQPEVSMTEPSGAPSKVAQERFSSLREILKQWNQGAPGFRAAEYDAETEAALRALGYLDRP